MYFVKINTDLILIVLTTVTVLSGFFLYRSRSSCIKYLSTKFPLLRQTGISLLLLFLFSATSSGQAVGDYRTRTTGNWSNRSTWERLNSLPSGWAQPSSSQGYPGQSSGTGTVTIRNGHNVTLNVSPANAIAHLNIGEGTSGSLTTSNNSNQTLSITGNLSVANGASFNLGRISLTIDGTTTINGSLTDNHDNGSALFNGQFIISATGSFETTNNSSFTFRGGISNNGTFEKGGSGTTSFNSSQTISGTRPLVFSGSGSVSIANNVTVTNQGIVSISGSATLNGAGNNSRWVNDTNSTLNYSSTQQPMNTGSLMATAEGNTVNYERSGDQTVKNTTYYNLTLSGSGSKTNTGVSVNGTLSLEGTATVPAAISYGPDAALYYNTSNIRTVTNNEWPATFSGTGGVVINAAATVSLNQAKVLGLNVPLVINSGASFNTANNELTFGGNFNNNGGEFNAGSSDINISNSGNQDIAGFTTTGRVSMTKSSGTVTLLGNISGTGFTVNGAGSIHLGNDLVHTFSGDFVFSNGTITGGSSTLRLGGTTSVTGGNFNAGTGTVEFYGGSQNVPGTTYHNLTISGGSTKSVINNHIRINGNLTLNNGILSLGNHDLTLGLGSSTNGSFSETSMIDIGTRTIVKEGNSASDFILTLPVGNGTAYTPVHIADLSVTSISPSAVLRVQTFSTPASGVPGKNPLKRHWITSTNGISGPVLADISFTYASNDIPDGGNAGVYEIVYRPSSGSWGTPDGASAPGSNPLRASAASSLNATWTGTIQEYHNFYSFSSGSWDNPGTWTLDPSGTQWLNPGNFTPSTSPTSDNDEVTILSGRTVTVPSDNKKNKTINIEGTLDLGTTTGHSFTVISGTGRIRLAGDNFPSGDATSFISDEQGKSVTEFYGNSRNLITPRNFSNVEVNLNGSNTLFLETDYLINGNLTVSGGILSIGSSSLTNTLNITVSGDLVVQESGRISTGTANARHQLNLFGDFINKGEARFTNRTAPEYMSEAINGIVDLRFLSDKRNQTIMCNGLTNFYRIEIDKGEDYTYVLNIEASEPGNFNLLGFANENHGSISQLTINRNALGLLKGTVRIGNNVEIPVLSQAGNYNISQRAQLWIDRGMVRKNSGTAIVVYGKVKISNGTLEALINSGITFRENGLINVEGGTLNANQIRTTTEGITTYGGYVQTGGTVNVVGGNTNTSFYVFSLPFPTSVFNMSGGTLKVNTSSANGAILINSGPENIKVTGGTVIAETQAGRDYQITSTAPFWNLELRNSTTARRHFRLTAATNIGPPGNQVNVPAQTLHVLNEFRIWGKESGGDNYPEIVFDPEGNDLYIGGSFFIEAGAVYSPVSGGIYPYDAIAHQPTGRNTTYFNRTAATRASEQLYWGEAVTQLEFGNLVIDRPNGHEVKLTSVSSRINESVLLDINGDATVRSGILNQNLYTIRTWGAIENNERMGVWMPGVTPSRAQIQFVENPALTLTTGQDAVFGNVQVNVTPPSVLTLSSDVYIERMEYVKGLIYLKNYNLKIDNLWNLETALFENIPTTSFLRVSDNGRSGSSMIYSDGKASDGGLTLRIAANSQAENENNILNNFGPVTFPVGFSSDGGTVLYFRPAQIVVKEVSSPGYITVRPVMGQLKTTDQSGGEILQHYWRVSHSGFTSLPLVAYRFYYRGQRGVSNVDLPAGASAELQYVPGKVLDQNPYTRLFEPLADNDIIRNIGPSNTRVITFNGTSNNGSFSPSSAGFTLENSNYTAGVSPRFTGSPIHYYSNPAGGAWHVAGTWDVGSKGSGIHAVPTTGSIVHIYNDNTNPNVQGTSRINVQSAGMPHFPAEIIFEMPNIPVEQSHSENIPRLQFHASGTYDLGFVRGRGMISYGANSIITNGDFGDFGTNSGSYYLFFSGPSQLTTIPAPIPNMMIEYSTNINQNIVVNYDLIIQGNALVQPLQDIDIRRDLVMGFWRGATFQFPATGRTVKVTVGRDIDFTRIPIANEIGNRIINTAPTAGTLEHTLVLKGSIIQGNNNNFSINLFGASNRSKAILELQGSEDAGYSRNSNSVPEFYRIVMDKGKNQSSSFTFNNHFNLRGPTNTDVKAITLQNGTLILNNPSINLDLTTGGNNFAIPASSCLEINQGTVRASGNSGISLDGMLSINGGIVNMSGGHNSIEYSASGNASIKITGGTLTVGGQIRRSPTSDVGVLNYFQSGGTVITGNNSAQVSNRGVFEILNPGSSFTMTGGNLHIARSQISPSIPAFYFDPDIVNTGTSATIHIGHGVTPAAQTIGIFAGKPLPRLIINNASGRNPAAKLEVVPAAITSLLQIDAGATFNANGLDLHLNGDMTVTGSYTPQGNTTFFSGGGTQTVNIGGSGVSFYNLDKTSSENLVLNGSNTTVSVAGSLYLRAGTFTDNGNSVTVRGNVLNDAIHVNNGSSGDGIIMNGDTPQKLFGNGIFGKLTINNGYGVSVTTGSQFTITRSLKMVKGVLNIGSSLLELGVNAEIEEASPFSATNMIETNISFTDNGLKKIFRAGSSPAFTFPMGSDNKYTPVIFNISANGDNTGSITVKPANEIHPAIIEDTETGAQIVDRDNALQYYWTLNAEGISGFSAEARMFYNENDIRVTAPYTIADYHTASLLEAGSGNWQKFPQTDFDEINKYLIFRFSETDDQGIRGDYTAGAGDATLNGAIPDMVSVYETVNNGNWSTAAVWNPAIAGGPRGAIARINAAHTIDVTTNNIAGYKTEIFGTLKLYSTSGHRLGIVNGNGTVYLEKGEIPAAVYEDFFSPAGGTIEFGGTTAYGFLGTVARVNNLSFSGSGERRFSNNNLTVNGNITIAGSSGLKVINQFNSRISIRGNLNRSSGLFDSGSGSNATLAFTGTMPQTISGSFTGINSLNNLEINNTSDVNILNNLEIKGDIRFINGLLNVDPGALLRLRLSAQALPESGLPQSFVNGTLIKELMNGNSFTFPVGSYQTVRAHGPLMLKNVSGPSGINDWGVTYFFSSPTLAGYNTANFESPVSTVSNSEYWKIEGPEGGKSVIRIILDGSSDVASSLPDLSNLRVVGWNPSADQWEIVGTSTAVSGTAVSGMITTSTAVDYDSYKYFTLASVTPVAIGSATITSPSEVNLCSGSSTAITVNFTGEMPYILTYTAGTVTHTTPAVNSPTYIITVSPAATTVYTLAAVSANGQPGIITGTSSVTVNVSPVPAVSLSSSVSGSVCEGSTVTFTATAGLANYSFRVNGNIVQDGAGNIFVTSTLPPGSQSVDVIATNTAGCSATSSAISLTVNPLPAAAGPVEGPVSVCLGDPRSFTVDPIAGATSYIWSATNGAQIATNGNRFNTITFPNAGETIVTVRGRNSCGDGIPSSITVIVSNLPPPGAAGPVSGPSQVCRGGSGYVYSVSSVANATSYIWEYTGSNAVIHGTGNSVTVDFLSGATSGSLRVRGTNGCADGAFSDNFSITVNQPPSVVINPTDPSVCSGTGLPITATASGGLSPYSYSWNGNGASFLSSVSISAPIFNSPDGGQFDLICTVTDNRGCTGTASRTVTVFPAPKADAGPDISGLCTGTMPIAMTGASASGSYSGTPVWSGAGGTWTQNPDPALATFTPSTPSGSTTATLTLTGANGCSNSTDERLITWNSIPGQPGFFTESSITVCRGQSAVVFTVPHDPAATSYNWTYTMGSGVTISGNGNSVTLDFSPAATSGRLSVSAVNSCGASIPRSVDIVVTIPPVATFIYPGNPYCPMGTNPFPVFTGGGVPGYFSSTPGLVFTDHSTGQVDLSASTPGDYIVTNTIAATGGCPAVTATSTISIISEFVWSGSADSDWNNPANWSCGVVPSAAYSVLIGNVTNKPVLSTGAAGAIKNLTIENGSSLTVTENTIRITGTITNNGVFEAGEATVELAGTMPQTINSSAFTGNTVSGLTVNNISGVTLNGELKVSGIVLIQNGTLNSNGNLTLLSTAGRTAMIDGSGSGGINGNVTMQRYLPSGFGYRYISSPFSNASVNQLADYLKLGSAFPMLYKYDENRMLGGIPATGWVRYNYPDSLLRPLHGYSANFGSLSGDTTFDVTGTVNNGYISRTLYNHNNPYTTGFNLVGNPYPSPVDWNAPSGWTKTNIDAAIYYFVASTTDQYGGTYRSYVGGIPVDTLATGIIPSMQGFFVHVSEGSYPVSGTLAMDNRVRVIDLKRRFAKSSKTGSTPLLRISAEFSDDRLSSDPSVIYFSENAETDFNGELDALKLMNTDLAVPNLYSIASDGSKLSINALPSSLVSGCKIPLGLRISRTGNVIFSVSQLDPMMGITSVYLSDAVEDISQDLMPGNRYSVSLDPGEYSNRFFIYLNTIPTGMEHVSTDELSFRTYYTRGTLVTDIGLGSAAKALMTVTNISGNVKLYETYYESGHYEHNINLIPGIYIVTVTCENRRITRKITVWK